MIDRIPTHVVPRDQHALKTLIRRVALEYGGVVRSIVLFGSKARGDDTVHSDIDVLIVVGDENWRTRYEIRMLGARISLDHDVLFNLYVIEQERWEWMQAIGHPLYRQIMDEGVDLTPAAV